MTDTTTATDVDRCPIRGCRHPQPGPDGQPVPGPLVGQNVICDHHWQRTATALTEFPQLYVALNLILEPGRSVTEQVTVSRTPPLAISVTVRSCQDDMLNVEREAERHYRHLRGWSRRPRRGREAPTLLKSAAWLGRHLDGLLTDPQVGVGVDLAAGVLDTHRTARRILGLNRLVHRLPAPCPSCDTLGLERADGSDTVRCQYCNGTWTEQDYGRLVLILAHDYREGTL